MIFNPDTAPGRGTYYFRDFEAAARSSKLEPIAADARSSAEIETVMAEAGVAGVEVSSWSGFFVPAGTPQEIIKKIHTDTVTVLAEPAVREKLEQGGVLVIGSTPDELGSFLKSEMDRWGQVIKDANIRGQ